MLVQIVTKMRKTILFIGLLLVSSGIFAQEVTSISSKDQKINQLIDILGSEEQYQAFINVGLDNLIKKYGSKLTDSNVKILREESLQMIQRFLDTDMKAIYSKYLSEKEIDDLITFYSSETGKRFRQMQPLITTEINQVMMNKYMEEFKLNIANQLKG